MISLVSNTASTINLLSSNILISGTNTSITQTSSLAVGTYTVTYLATDFSGLTMPTTRTLTIYTPQPKIAYDLTNGYLGPIYKSYQILNNSDWTIECWMNLTSFDYGFLFDNRNLSTPNSGYFVIQINDFGIPRIISLGGVISSQNIMPTNQWAHIVWMFKNNVYYGFINGVCGIPQTCTFGPISNNEYIVIGADGTNNRPVLKGKISQPLITLGAKYPISGFIPTTDLTPPNFNNVLFWIQNGVEVISGQTVILNGTVITSNFNI